MSNYTEGARYERKVLGELSRMGYVACRSAGSHSPADVFAFKFGTCLLVQCKKNGRLDPDEWNKLFDYATKVEAIPLLARPGGRGCGTIYSRLTSRKDGRGRQPLAPYEP